MKPEKDIVIFVIEQVENTFDTACPPSRNDLEADSSHFFLEIARVRVRFFFLLSRIFPREKERKKTGKRERRMKFDRKIESI